tara:strand:- start:96 stop:377 length:282 start_codon:yes stop_codon:yes gene_type:complete
MKKTIALALTVLSMGTFAQADLSTYEAVNALIKGRDVMDQPQAMWECEAEAADGNVRIGRGPSRYIAADQSLIGCRRGSRAGHTCRVVFCGRL